MLTNEYRPGTRSPCPLGGELQSEFHTSHDGNTPTTTRQAAGCKLCSVIPTKLLPSQGSGSDAAFTLSGTSLGLILERTKVKIHRVTDIRMEI